MIIAIDARALADPLGDAYGYTLNLVHSLAFVDRETQFHLFVDAELPAERFPVQDNVHVAKIDAPRRVWKASALQAAAEAVKADLIHVQGLLPVTPRHPVVTTIRHLGPLHEPKRYQRVYAWAWRHLLPRQIADAAAVLVPWQAVCKQVLAELPVSTNRLAITPYGVEPLFSPQCESVISYAVDRLRLAQPYVIGRPDPAEGPRPVIAVWRKAKELGLDAELILDGEGEDEVRGLVALETKVWPALLSGAVGTIIGGRRDSAAMAMLETMACGTPPVGADTPILREIAGNTGCLGTPDQQAAGLVALQDEDESVRAARLRGNLTRAQRHDWPKLAEQTIGIYRAVLAGEPLPTADVTAGE